MIKKMIMKITRQDTAIHEWNRAFNDKQHLTRAEKEGITLEGYKQLLVCRRDIRNLKRSKDKMEVLTLKKGMDVICEKFPCPKRKKACVKVRR